MRAGGFDIRHRDAVRWYIAAGLLNQGLPSVVGGDAFRTWAAIEASVEPRHARLRIASLITVFDRLVGLCGSLVLAGIGMVVTGATLAPWAPRLGALALAALGLGWLVTALLTRRFTPRPGWQAALRASLKPHIVAMSVLVHAGNVIAMALCLRATGLHATPFQLIPPLLMLLPALGILLLLPLSVAGWGVRETALSAALLLWGVPTTTTVAASIAYGLATVVSLLPGAVTLATTRLSRNESSPAFEPAGVPESPSALQTRQ
jgi:glycosyltransferase 2 family protein